MIVSVFSAATFYSPKTKQLFLVEPKVDGTLSNNLVTCQQVLLWALALGSSICGVIHRGLIKDSTTVSVGVATITAIY